MCKNLICRVLFWLISRDELQDEIPMRSPTASQIHGNRHLDPHRIPHTGDTDTGSGDAETGDSDTGGYMYKSVFIDPRPGTLRQIADFATRSATESGYTKERYLEHRINLRTKSSSWGFRIDHIYSPDPSTPYVGQFETPDKCSHLQKATTLHYGFKNFKTMYPSGNGFNPQTHKEEGSFQELFNEAIIRDSNTNRPVDWRTRYRHWARNERRRISRIVNEWHKEEEEGTIYGDDPNMESWLQVCRDLEHCLSQEHLNQAAREMLSAETGTTFPSGDSSKISGTSEQGMEWIQESPESATVGGTDGEGGHMEAEVEYGRGEERKDLEGTYDDGTGEEITEVERRYEAERGEERIQVERTYADGRGDERLQVEGTYADGRGDESGEKFGNGREISQHIPEPGPNRAECTEVSADPGQADRDNRWRPFE